MNDENAVLLNGGMVASSFPEWSLPSFPQPRAPLLQDIPVQINIVFMGVPQSLVNETVLRDQLLDWYAPIAWGRYETNRSITPYINFTLNYKITFMDSPFANSYAQFILDNHREDFAPYWIQQLNVTDRAWYMMADEAEQWFAANTPQSILNSGYTIFIVDTFHTTPSITQYYFYNGSVADHDLGWDPVQYMSQYMIAYGGHHRFLFLDLNAGPTIYQNKTLPENSIRVYDPSNPYHVEVFSLWVEHYVSRAIELRFIPSWYYTPKYYPSYHVRLIIFSDDHFNYLNHIDLDEMLKQYQALHPYSKFSVEATQVDLSDYPELYNVVQQSYNPSTREVNPQKIKAYFLSHLEEYVLPHGDDKVLPIFCLAGDFDFTDYRGKACSDEYGNPAFVLEYVNKERIGLQWKKIYWVEDSRQLLYGSYFYYPIYSLGMSWHRNFLNLTVNVLSGRVDFYILDLFNFNKLMNGEVWEPIVSRTGWSSGSHRETFSPPYVKGRYFLLLYNPYANDVQLEIDISIYRTGGSGLTNLNIHEAGHFFGLSHPHDGFSWRYHYKWLGEYSWAGLYEYWLWDFSSTPMTYAAQNEVFDELNSDQAYRYITVDVLNDTFNMLSTIDSGLRSFGFETVPPAVMENFTSSVQLSSLAIDSFSGLSLPDYGASFVYAYQAYESARQAYSAFRASLLEISCRVEDANGNPLLDAMVDVTYPNGTSLTLQTNASGYFTLSKAPWGNYSYTVRWQGSEVGEKAYSEVVSVDRVLQAEVYSLILSFEGSDGNLLKVLPSRVILVAPNGTALTIGDYSIAQAQEGVWDLTSVVYEETEVVPMPHPSISLSSNYQWPIRCRVYSLLLSLEDYDGNPLEAQPSRVTLVAPNGTTLTINRYLISQAQVGEWIVASIIYQGGEVIPEPTLSTSLSSNYQWPIRCRVYSLKVDVRDFFGLPISGGLVKAYRVGVLVGSEITGGDGVAVFPQLSEGNYTIEASYIQTSIETVSLTSPVTMEVIMASYVVIGAIVVGIGVPAIIAIILVRRRRKGLHSTPNQTNKEAKKDELET